MFSSGKLLKFTKTTTLFLTVPSPKQEWMFSHGVFFAFGTFCDFGSCRSTTSCSVESQHMHIYDVAWRWVCVCAYFSHFCTCAKLFVADRYLHGCKQSLLPKLEVNLLAPYLCALDIALAVMNWVETWFGRFVASLEGLWRLVLAEIEIFWLQTSVLLV